MRSFRLCVVLASVMAFSACGDEPSRPDGQGVDAGVGQDAASADAALGNEDGGSSEPDSGTIAEPDGGAADSGSSDAGEPDGSFPDAGAPDAEVSDGGAGDAGEPDAGAPDGSAEDAGEPDAGEADAGQEGEDAGGELDAGPEDAGWDAGAEDAGELDAGAADGGPADGGEPDAGSDAGSETGFFPLRVMAANLTSGNYQSYDPGEGIRLIQGVQPDVVLIQELNYGDKSELAIQQFVDVVLPGYSWCREGGASIPNGIISRWPIVECGEWDDPEEENRDFAWARIDVPGERDLWAISLHLLTSRASVRNTEARSLVQHIQAELPVDDYLVLGGDLNTNARTESCFETLDAVVVTAGPHPVDNDGNGGTNASRLKPYDHVLADRDLAAYQVPTVIGSSTFDGGLVLDSRVYVPIYEIAPALASDSAASNMQHMGVVKDFLVPY